MPRRQDAARTPRKRKRDYHGLNAAKMIDAAFAEKVVITIGGRTVEISTFRAIVLQLWIKSMKDKRALRVLSRYQAYAAKRTKSQGPWILFEEPAP